MTAPSSRQHPESEYRVTPLELFFDVVFVFGVSQLSHYLAAELSWRGAMETLVMLVALFSVWLVASWSATLIRADEDRTRWMILTVMLLGLFMNASVRGAFNTSGWAFVVPLLVIHLGRSAWMVVNSPDPVFRAHYNRVLLWSSATAPLWIVGAFVGRDVRLLWWGAAAAIDTTGRWLAHPIPGRRLRWENVPFDAEHLLERCRLFLIIALGETVFTTGEALAVAPRTLMTVVTGTAALAATVALWALNFEHSERLTRRYRQETRDPIRTGRYAMNTLIVMVAGLITVAVASERVVAEPQRDTSAALGLLLYGGPVLYLLAQGWFLRTIHGDSPRLRLFGSGALVLLGFAASTAPRYLALVLVALGLMSLVLLDQRRIRLLEA